MEFHLTATECHLPYGITQCYLPPDTSELNTLRLNRVLRYLTLLCSDSSIA